MWSSLSVYLLPPSYCPTHPQVDESTYRTTLDYINEEFDKAEALNCRNYTEGCVACLTGYTIHYCFKTNYERVRQLVLTMVKL